MKESISISLSARAVFQASLFQGGKTHPRPALRGICVQSTPAGPVVIGSNRDHIGIALSPANAGEAIPEFFDVQFRVPADMQSALGHGAADRAILTVGRTRQLATLEVTYDPKEAVSSTKYQVPLIVESYPQWRPLVTEVASRIDREPIDEVYGERRMCINAGYASVWNRVSPKQGGRAAILVYSTQPDESNLQHVDAGRSYVIRIFNEPDFFALLMPVTRTGGDPSLDVRAIPEWFAIKETK